MPLDPTRGPRQPPGPPALGYVTNLFTFSGWSSYLIRVSSDDIDMYFSLSNVVTSKLQGKAACINGMALMRGYIVDVEQGYKYLGVLQSHNGNDAGFSQKAEKEYRKVFRSFRVISGGYYHFKDVFS